ESAGVWREALTLRYKTWRSRKNPRLHLLCVEGSEPFESLPVAFGNPGPWTGGPGGEGDRLWSPYRFLLSWQGVVLHCHGSHPQCEPGNVGVLQTANAECPRCQGSGRVPIYLGLRHRNCPRCGGRGWIKPPPCR